MKNIQVHEPSLIECVLQYKHLMNILHEHYYIKACTKHLPQGRPNKGLTFLDNTNPSTFFDRLINFVFSELCHSILHLITFHLTPLLLLFIVFVCLSLHFTYSFSILFMSSFFSLSSMIIYLYVIFNRHLLLVND